MCPRPLKASPRRFVERVVVSCLWVLKKKNNNNNNNNMNRLSASCLRKKCRTRLLICRRSLFKRKKKDAHARMK